MRPSAHRAMKSSRCRPGAWPKHCAMPTTTCRTIRARSTPHGGASRTTSCGWTTSAKFPFTTKADLRDNYPFGLFAVPRGAGRADARLLRHDRQADRGRLHAAATSTSGPTVVARSIRAAGGRRGHEPAQRLWLRAVHRRAWRALRRRAAGLTVDPGVRRHDRAAGAAHRRLPPRYDHGHAQLHAGDPRRVRAARASTRATARCRSASSAPSPGPTPCAARSRAASTCDAVDIYGLSEVIGPGRGARMRRDQGRPAHLGRPFPTRRSSIPKPAPCCPTAPTASWCSPR